jgi:hypothetical protein
MSSQGGPLYAGGKSDLMKWADAWHEKPTPKAVKKKPR